MTTITWLLLCISLRIMPSTEALPNAIPCAGTTKLPVVRNLSDIPQDSYGRPGLSHMTIAGAAHHGMKEVEIWMQTFAPGSGTPIHRHSCEEVFIVLKGLGTLYLAPHTENKVLGHPTKYEIFPNSTFTIPVNAVHKLENTNTEEDLQVLVVISRPPIMVFIYKDWLTPHMTAQLKFPYTWDTSCLGSLEEDDYSDEL